MHGVRLVDDVPNEARDALPLLTLNSATMLGAEVLGRAYGGGVLKMEPSEAASLPVPSRAHLRSAWRMVCERRAEFDSALRLEDWRAVVSEVDRVLLKDAMGLDMQEIAALRNAAALLRVRRTRQTESDV
jgi:hypothetical protein